MFTGTSIDKIRSIFNVFEIYENNVFEAEVFIDYISNSLKEMNIDWYWINSINLADICGCEINFKRKRKNIFNWFMSRFEYIVLE